MDRMIPGLSRVPVTILALRRRSSHTLLERAGANVRVLLIQDQGRLPAMRPPVLLDASSMEILDLARVLQALGSGAVDGWASSTPFPVTAIVEPYLHGHQRLLACSPAVTATLAEPLQPQLLGALLLEYERSLLIRRTRQPWFGAPPPSAPLGGDVYNILLALEQSDSLPSAAEKAYMSRATFYRRLEELQQSLPVQPQVRRTAKEWLVALLHALDQPGARA